MFPSGSVIVMGFSWRRLRRSSSGRLIPHAFAVRREGGLRLRRERAADVDALRLLDLARRRRRQPPAARPASCLTPGRSKTENLPVCWICGADGILVLF